MTGILSTSKTSNRNHLLHLCHKNQRSNIRVSSIHHGILIWNWKHVWMKSVERNLVFSNWGHSHCCFISSSSSFSSSTSSFSFLFFSGDQAESINTVEIPLPCRYCKYLAGVSADVPDVTGESNTIDEEEAKKNKKNKKTKKIKIF